ncbi:uncharacterized protein LOC119684006 [Teleopsis dalmanni]|uniref:uncharacterized protein LOC119684006 n=1 Tax=Teleopsis dalmanni TaxID=139649 RepID=UPI0018CCDFD8|nr:uncharacterized protein LOC119684006 [Teleopsis dalmanni]
MSPLNTNNIAPTPPAWLTCGYLEHKLQIYHNNTSLKIINLEIVPATAQGENYLSIMWRIKVSYSVQYKKDMQTSSYIAKTCFQDNSVSANVINEFNMFPHEMKIYEKILPKLTEILKEIGYEHKMFADAVYVDYENSAIIFEDLSTQNFVTADRVTCLDMEHVKVVLSTLAKFHAAGAVLNERMPGIFAQNYDRGMMNRRTTAFQPKIEGVLTALARYVESESDLKEKYYEKLSTLITRAMEYGARVFDVNDQHFMTLVHGDFWTSNIMFRYSDNVPISIVPVDFQFSVWTSPAIDLHYFFNTSLQEDLRLYKQPELIQFYYYNLANTLRSIKYHGHIPSLFDFKIQVEMRSFLALTSAFIYQPVMICEETEDASFKNLVSNSEEGIRFKKTLFRNERVQKNLKRLLPIFDQKGLLDVMD